MFLFHWQPPSVLIQILIKTDRLMLTACLTASKDETFILSFTTVFCLRHLFYISWQLSHFCRLPIKSLLLQLFALAFVPLTQLQYPLTRAFCRQIWQNFICIQKSTLVRSHLICSFNSNSPPPSVSTGLSTLLFLPHRAVNFVNQRRHSVHFTRALMTFDMAAKPRMMNMTRTAVCPADLGFSPGIRSPKPTVVYVMK